MRPLTDTIKAIYEHFPTNEVLTTIANLMQFDRYQASEGIEKAAEMVAEVAESAGLQEIKILRYPADGKCHWWTFRAPLSWSPISAQLKVEGKIITSYPANPCSIATNSIATPIEGIVAPLVEYSPSVSKKAFCDAVVVISKADRTFSRVLEHICEAGPIGIITDSFSQWDATENMHQIGRIELPASTKLFGFSIDTPTMYHVRQATQNGASAQVFVDIHRRATMPIVTGILPGLTKEEILLQAHLCHQSPGANDNLSGVGALLGIVRTLNSLRKPNRSVHSIRFLWGPEFVGTAAYLYDVIEQGKGVLPLYILNLDMVGEDQERCGGPLIIERSPDHVPSFINALVERCVELLPQSSLSYSKAVSADTWTWRSTPFVGASDHTVFADRSIARPAIQLGHWPDRFNHSSADTLDKINPNELKRSATVAGASALIISELSNSDLPWLEKLVALWGAKRLREITQAGIESTPSQSGLIDPISSEEVIGRLYYTYEVVSASLAATSKQVSLGAIQPKKLLAKWLQRQACEMALLLPQRDKENRDTPIDSTKAPLCSRWLGPFNLQGLLEDAPQADREWAIAEISRNRQAYCIMLALALAIDGKASRHTLMRRAAYSSDLAVNPSFATRFFDLLIKACWAEES